MHLGGGRYYDPSLGRPLQPNAQSGLPGVPQSLNRYAALALGQVGVAQAESQSLFSITMLYDIGVDLGALATGSSSGFATYMLSKGTPRLVMTGKTKGIGRKTEEFFFSKESLKAFRSGRVKSIASGPLLTGEGKILSQADASKAIKSTITRVNNRLGSTLFLSPYSRMAKPRTSLLGIKFTFADALEGGGAGFIFDSAWSYYQDMSNPFLTSRQRFARAGVVGLTGFVAGGLVVLTVGTGGTGFVVSLIVGWTVEAWVADRVFEAVPGLQPQRHLKPLQ